MIPTLILLLTGLNPQPLVADEVFDRVELNHFYDENAKHVFDQMIFWRHYKGDNRYHVEAWRLVKRPDEVKRPNIEATKDYKRGLWTVIWFDGETLRKITAYHFVETWTQHDPELVEREFKAKERRPDLAKQP